MRAILIDPETKQVTEIQITDDDGEHERILHCDGVSRVATLAVGGEWRDTLYASDDAEDDHSPVFRIRVDEYPSAIEVRGRGLVFGTNREQRVVIDLHLSLEEVVQRVMFDPPGFVAHVTDDQLRAGLAVQLNPPSDRSPPAVTTTPDDEVKAAGNVRVSTNDLAPKLRDLAAELNAVVPDIGNSEQRLDANYIARKMDRLADEWGDHRPKSSSENLWNETQRYFDERRGR